MTRLLVLAEGVSEELFVRRMLAPHLLAFSVFATPIVVETKRLENGRRNRGGNYWPHVRKSLLPLLCQQDAWVTTLLDFYGLQDDFPGIRDAKGEVERVERSLAETMSHPRRFIPFLTKHEFEAWYFSAPEAFDTHFGCDGISAQLAEVTRVYGGPEEINHGSETHPSKRLESLCVGFRKTREVSLLEKIGIPAIRSACPHFAQWLDRLEALDDPQG